MKLINSQVYSKDINNKKQMNNKEKDIKDVKLLYAIIPILFLLLLLSLNVFLFSCNIPGFNDTLDGANQIALLLSAAVAGLFAYKSGFSFKHILEHILKSINTAMPSIIILLLIGALAGTWLLSGIVPTIVYYGLNLIHPKIFLVAAVVVSGIVSLATGSSWSTIATIGIALNGIGQALGFNPGLVAGAIISGAYFGDKMSPLSDTTNLASAVTGTNLFVHIRYMTLTTVPSMTITLILFLIIGFTYHTTTTSTDIIEIKKAISNAYNINPWLLIVPVFLIFIIIKKVQAIPALLIGVLSGGIFAVIFQPGIIHSMIPEATNYFQQSYLAVLKSMYGEINIATNNESIDNLLVSSGMGGMLLTIWLILSAMIFGGVLESAGFLLKLATSVINYAKSTGSLIAATAATSVFFNITASDQYMAIVVPGRMYAPIFKKRGYAPEVLSRTLEDAGTVTSVLVPWNSGGATQSRVLGVPTIAYLPYCFFNLISPLMSVLVAYLNFKIRKTSNDNNLKTLPEK